MVMASMISKLENERTCYHGKIMLRTKAINAEIGHARDSDNLFEIVTIYARYHKHKHLGYEDATQLILLILELFDINVAHKSSETTSSNGCVIEKQNVQ